MSVYPTIINKINAILATIPTTVIAQHASHPQSRFAKYPAVVFYPVTVTNTFETNQENRKTYVFKMFVIIGATQTSIANVYDTVMPGAVDAILQAFDSSWDLDEIDGHRVWQQMEEAGWNASEEQDGLMVTAEFNILINLLTTN